MPRLNTQQIIYIIAGVALLVALLLTSYKVLAALTLLFFATPPVDSRRAAIKEQVEDAEQDVKEQVREEQATKTAKTDAGKQASQEVDSFIDGEW